MTGAVDSVVLLTWMRKRDSVITGRDISDSGPRSFRRRAAAETALAALMETGEIIEVSSRPRAFRVVLPKQPMGEFPPPTSLAREIPEQTTLNGKHIQGSQVGEFPPLSRSATRDRLDAAIAQHRQAGRSLPAALILAAADVRDGMRRDPHHAPKPHAYGRCQHCDGDIEGGYAELLHGVRVHVGCVLRYRNAVDRQMDEIIVAALEQSL